MLNISPEFQRKFVHLKGQSKLVYCMINSPMCPPSIMINDLFGNFTKLTVEDGKQRLGQILSAFFGIQLTSLRDNAGDGYLVSPYDEKYGYDYFYEKLPSYYNQSFTITNFYYYLCKSFI